MKWSVFLLLLILGAGAGVKAECVPADNGVYVLGSSYSWDAQSPDLDDSTWHIFCAKSIDLILNDPFGLCVGSSTPWPGVLEPPAETYDYISFQPVPNDASTQQQDIDHITYWLAEQPICTVGVIQATWPKPDIWETDIHEPNPDHTFTNYSVAYFYDLKMKLRLRNPGRKFVLTRSNEMLDRIFHDPAAPLAFDDLFRDSAGHMSLGPGRYLQHNAFRQAMGQTTGVDVTSVGVDPIVKGYLDAVIALYPSAPVAAVPAMGRRALVGLGIALMVLSVILAPTVGRRRG
jgi:hypothetical protein